MTTTSESTGHALDISVLMPVHGRADLAQLAAALESVVNQTLQPSEIVVVLDDPVPVAQRDLLSRFPGVRVVTVPPHSGMGRACARGLEECRSTWVARADADDLNEPQRLERQLALLASSGADVCSADMTEFEGSPDRVLGVRRGPREHREFARRMRSRNPVHHPTAVFRRDAALRSGGYGAMRTHEDYDLWARMLRDGARFVGAADPLVRYRTDGMLARRSGNDLRAERDLQRRLRDYGVVGPVRSRVNRIVRGAYLRLPTPVLGRVYALVFRR